MYMQYTKLFPMEHFSFKVFCKISIKGRAAELKMKMAKKLRKFSSIEISTFEYKL